MIQATQEKNRMSSEMHEVRDHLDIKDRKLSVLQRKVSRKKVLFNGSAIKTLTPTPLKLNDCRNFGLRKEEVLNKIFFLNGTAFNPPPSIVNGAAKKEFFLRLP